MRSSPALVRSASAVLLALLLALRVLSPAGSMPAFERGHVSIVACPDQDGATPAPPMHHGHGDPKKAQQQCPFAFASGLGAVAAGFGLILNVLILAAALLLGRTFLFLERNSARERPPTRAPPFPA